MKKSTTLITVMLLLFVGVQNVYAQLPSKVEKLVGKWEYKRGSGTEEFKISGDTLVGTAALLDKYGVETPVEEMTIKMVNGNLIYSSTKIVHDTTLPLMRHVFVSKGKRLKFYNTEDDLIVAIKYKVRFWNPKKMVLVLYSSNDEKRKLKLIKQ